MFTRTSIEGAGCSGKAWTGRVKEPMRSVIVNCRRGFFLVHSLHRKLSTAPWKGGQSRICSQRCLMSTQPSRRGALPRPVFLEPWVDGSWAPIIDSETKTSKVTIQNVLMKADMSRLESIVTASSPEQPVLFDNRDNFDGHMVE